MDDSEKALIALYNYLAAERPIPKEDGYYLQDRIWGWLTSREMSLDEAFGYSKAGTHVMGRRKKQKNIPVVYEACQEYLARGEKLEPNWEDIGKRVGMGGDYAKNLYYSTKVAYEKLLKDLGEL